MTFDEAKQKLLTSVVKVILGSIETVTGLESVSSSQTKFSW